jgi:hypothetical protein
MNALLSSVATSVSSSKLGLFLVQFSVVASRAGPLCCVQRFHAFPAMSDGPRTARSEVRGEREHVL